MWLSDRSRCIDENSRPSLKTAKAKNLKYYYSKKPCLNGHEGKRLVANNTCCACIKERLHIKNGRTPDADAVDKRRAIEDHQSRKRDEYDF